MKQVALVGRGNTWTEAPFNNLDIEIWSMNDLHTFIPRAERWFEMHKRSVMDKLMVRGTKDGNYIEGLKKLKIPIVMEETQPDIPNSIKFPLDDFLSNYRRIYTSTICYMLAMAINEKYEKIYLYGIGSGSGYPHQTEAIAYWIGYAEAKGIEIYIHPDSIILSEKRLYGYED